MFVIVRIAWAFAAFESGDAAIMGDGSLSNRNICVHQIRSMGQRTAVDPTADDVAFHIRHTS